MQQKENLYFIALIPKRELREKINAFKNDFANRFKSEKALKVYPHITLKAPFKLPANAHTELIIGSPIYASTKDQSIYS